MIKRLFGTTSNGKEVYAYTLDNGVISVTVLSLGATVQSLVFNGRDVTLGYDTVKEYEQNDGYVGAVLGRYAGIISDASFRINGKKYGLYANSGRDTLNGGNNGFDKAIWKLKSYSGNSVSLIYYSHDGEEGFPSNLLVTMTYYVDGAIFGMECSAVSDGDTPVNIVNNVYFNLYREGVIDDQFLTIYADKYNPIAKNLAPTGEIAFVKDTPFDFTLVKRIGRDIDVDDEQIYLASGYNHNFIINGNGYRKFAEVSSPKSGVKMTGYTDNFGVGFYTGNLLTLRKGKGNNVIDRRGGFCLVTQNFPNAVNQRHFPDPLLKNGQLYRTITEYKFEKY